MAARYKVRRGVPGDLESILALDRATESLPHWPAAEYSTALEPHTEGALQRCVFVAELLGELVGFGVTANSALTDEAELESVAVSLAARRQGVGRELCAATIAWSRAEGAKLMHMEVRSRSTGAIALYARLGFTATGLRRRYYRQPEDDAVQMTLILQTPASPAIDL